MHGASHVIEFFRFPLGLSIYHGLPESLRNGLGCYYLLLCAMNWIAALAMWRNRPVVYFRLGPLEVKNWFVWFVVGCFFLTLSPAAFIDESLGVSGGAKRLINTLSGPTQLTVGSAIILVVAFLGRRLLTKPPVAWALFNFSLLFMGASMTDANFAAIVGKPDNVPIVGLVFLLGFFTWLAAHKA